MGGFPVIEYKSEDALECNGDALDFLQSVYRNSEVPLPARMKAASIAIEYERPRLAVQAHIEGRDLATLLDAARARMEKLEEAKVIEQAVEPITATPILPVPDKRYRR